MFKKIIFLMFIVFITALAGGCKDLLIESRVTKITVEDRTHEYIGREIDKREITDQDQIRAILEKFNDYHKDIIKFPGSYHMIKEETMDRHPLETIKQTDPGFFAKVTQDRDHAFREGALPVKVKYLIAMALDAGHGAAGGVTSLARQAVEHGASKEEIMESLYIANFISGVGTVYTASQGLSEVF
jgi:alkylhydroperoxidase/carboxymuconolactone decarboxylase family protein YurZ